jgi:hypothetical protein
MPNVNFLDAAMKYLERGIMTMPLVLDKGGYPKRPIVSDWSQLQRDEDVLRSLDWHMAKGLGIVLGEASSNLAALDVDSVSLSDTLIAMFRGERPPYIVRTARNRSHIYVQEEAASASKAQRVMWDGEPISIELKAQGTQIAAPPTPGYQIAIKAPFHQEQSVGVLWATIQKILTSKHPGRFSHIGGETGTGNFPAPWQPDVAKDFRNKSLYVEAHRLREAKMPYHDALETLMLRVEHHYADGDFSRREIERTVQSAYRKGVEPDANTRRISDWLTAFR